MKTLVTALTLALASGQVLADGFYQQVVNQAAPATQPEIYGDSEFTYSPLYLQVVGNGERTVDFEQVDINSNTRFSYTPLYTKVIGETS